MNDKPKTVDDVYFFDNHWCFSADGQLRGQFSFQTGAKEARDQWREQKELEAWGISVAL